MDFSPLQDFFDHIYVITVESAIDRQAKMIESLEGLKFTFFIGAYKKDFTIDELIEANVYDEEKAKSMHRFDKPMNTTQIGCAWTHRLVYEDMLENNYKRVLILEDDIVPNKEGLSQVQEMIGELPNDWELWYLDFHKNLRRSFSTWLKQQALHVQHVIGKLKWSHKMINNMYARKYKPHLFKAGNHEFASAYGITRSAAEKLVRLQTPLCFQSDHLLAYSCTNELVQGYVSFPKVFLNSGQLVDKRTKEKYVVE
ncbi:glycosyltransferase family 25 protein [Aridibaculum aurantiacum]|uniref:glycosyltransferase family 25 protein n=1 Tax=Aridibaculum aurantiacum TaxID=2810307 RepID=UPI001A9597AC|nr:glycosyltransferase family 25 protein [Aridibaculum aurantiacum]